MFIEAFRSWLWCFCLAMFIMLIMLIYVYLLYLRFINVYYVWLSLRQLDTSAWSKSCTMLHKLGQKQGFSGCLYVSWHVLGTSVLLTHYPHAKYAKQQYWQLLEHNYHNYHNYGNIGNSVLICLLCLMILNIFQSLGPPAGDIQNYIIHQILQDVSPNTISPSIAKKSQNDPKCKR